MLGKILVTHSWKSWPVVKFLRHAMPQTLSFSTLLHCTSVKEQVQKLNRTYDENTIRKSTHLATILSFEMQKVRWIDTTVDAPLVASDTTLHRHLLCRWSQNKIREILNFIRGCTIQSRGASAVHVLTDPIQISSLLVGTASRAGIHLPFVCLWASSEHKLQDCGTHVGRW